MLKTNLYKVKYKMTPKSEIRVQIIEALSEQHAELKVKYENDIALNEIEFLYDEKPNSPGVATNQ